MKHFKKGDVVYHVSRGEGIAAKSRSRNGWVYVSFKGGVPIKCTESFLQYTPWPDSIA